MLALDKCRIYPSTLGVPKTRVGVRGSGCGVRTAGCEVKNTEKIKNNNKRDKILKKP